MPLRILLFLMGMQGRFAILAPAAVIAALAAMSSANADPQAGIAMHDAPKYGPAFTRFDYVNPDAPKGGALRLGVLGSFDSLNPFIVKGAPVAGMREYVYETLLARSYDEPFSLYGLLAESVETPEDRSWVIFQLRPEARFADGTPITPEDVLFSWSLLKGNAAPQPPALLWKGRNRGEDWRTRREVHLRGRRRP